MTQLMNAICKMANGGLVQKKVPRPEKAQQEHLLIRMKSSAISHGDKAFINQPFPPGAVNSQYDVFGSSGAGEVIEIGSDVPENYLGKNVTIYRSLHNSDVLLGCWSEYAHVHYLDCVILPDDAQADEYCGSLANIITPYAFRMQSLAEGHTGIICTAGTSTTGIMMLGISLALNFPLISIVRNRESKRKLEELGAVNVLVQDSPDFNEELKGMAEKLKATAVYDAVGGALLNRIVNLVPNGSTIYCYGFLGDDLPVNVFMRQILFKGLTIKSFSNIGTPTVRDPKQLIEALKFISGIIHMPHFKTKVGKRFELSEIDEALIYLPVDIDKAILGLN